MVDMARQPWRLILGLTLMATLILSVEGVASVSATAATSYGTVYALTNSLHGNSVLIFQRSSDGTLTKVGSVATGGRGSGVSLGSEGSLVVAASGQWLLAVNAGSNTVSALRIQAGGGLQLANVAFSGGTNPVSVTEHDGLVYAVNAGSDSLGGLRLSSSGVARIPHSIRALSTAGVGPGQVSFSPDGRAVLVTEKNTNLIDSFSVNANGRLGPLHTQASSGQEPFGFALTGGFLVASEAFGGAPGASAASSYEVSANGMLQTVSASVPDGQTAACWALAFPGSTSVYVTNTGSNTVSRYVVGPNGALTLADAVAAGTGLAPADMASVSGDLYVRNGDEGTISEYSVDSAGALTPLAKADGLPKVQAGLAAR
jgi:6-phosphogluconolactonase (cycloisomerase 2 family)